MSIIMLYGMISVVLQILSCANSRSVIGSNPAFPFLEKLGLAERDAAHEERSLVYLRPKPVEFHPIISHSSSFHRLHDPPWGPAKLLKSHSMDTGGPMSAEIESRITSLTNINFDRSFQHSDDLFKHRLLQDATTSLENIFEDTSSQEDLFEEIRRRASSAALDQAFLKLEALFDGSEEGEQRCVQEELWGKYGEDLKRRFKHCDFFVEHEHSRWKRYITNVSTCGKGSRKVKRSCRNVYSNGH